MTQSEQGYPGVDSIAESLAAINQRLVASTSAIVLPLAQINAAISPATTIVEQVAKQIVSSSALDSYAQIIRGIASAPAFEAMRRIGKFYYDISRSIDSVLQQISPNISKVIYIVNDWILYVITDTATVDSGWLPYRTVPFRQILRDAGANRETLSMMLDAHYDSAHLSIVDDIEASTSTYTVDNEAIETLREALEVHRSGHYRASSRTLMPEIERVVREKLLNKKGIYVLRHRDIGPNSFIMPAGQFFTGDSGDRIVANRIESDLFRHVDTIQDVQGQPTPNRHAMLHAWVPYSSVQNSLNTIILADYIFRLVTAQKSHDEDDAAQ